jgi:hypothetical protein
VIVLHGSKDKHDASCNRQASCTAVAIAVILPALNPFIARPAAEMITYSTITEKLRGKRCVRAAPPVMMLVNACNHLDCMGCNSGVLSVM